MMSQVIVDTVNPQDVSYFSVGREHISLKASRATLEKLFPSRHRFRANHGVDF